MLARLASFSFRRRRLVLVTWVVGMIAVLVLAGRFGSAPDSNGRLKGTDSDAAEQAYRRAFPDQGRDGAIVVLTDRAGIAAGRPSIERYLHELAAVPGVAAITSPLDVPAQQAHDGKVAYASVVFSPGDGATQLRTATAMQATADRLAGTGVEVAFAGPYFSSGEMPSSELIGVLAAVVILLVAFGSVVAMGVPIVTALIGVVIALAGVHLWAAAVPTLDATIQVASTIGIGVGIDYALFIVTRYREALRRLSPHDAVVEAIDVAGRAVLFAGITVMISLLGIVIMGLDLLKGLALGSATAVLVAMAAAVTLLPAMLGFVGGRIDRLAVHRRHTGDPRRNVWHRWAGVVQRRPVAGAIGGIAVLVLLALPLAAMHLASADAGNDPAGSTTRTAYDQLASGFGPGFNGPLLLVVDGTDATVHQVADRLGASLRSTPGVVYVSEPQWSPSGRTALVTAVPSTSPQSGATATLVRHLRSTVLPSVVAGSTTQIHVGGQTAADVDFADVMSSRLPYLIAAVLACSFLVLLMVFRSILVPLKAVVMNLASIGAAYGLMVAVFQWGWLGSLLRIEPAPIEPWVPMMLFAIVFGLSMDYEVFLLSSVKERYDHGLENRAAVAEGLASSARVITAAAAIMVCVFGTFVMADIRALKLIGFGLATAVLIDATIVRIVVVPSTMELLGDRNWWMPAWLDRLLPRLRLEGVRPSGRAAAVPGLAAADRADDGAGGAGSAPAPGRPEPAWAEVG